MLKLSKHRLSHAALMAATFALASQPAFAAGAGGANAMPWESGLTQISASLQGPVAYAIAIIGFIIAAIAFVIQGEMTGFTKKLIQAVFGISVLLSVGVLINNFFGVASATIF